MHKGKIIFHTIPANYTHIVQCEADWSFSVLTYSSPWILVVIANMDICKSASYVNC